MPKAADGYSQLNVRVPDHVFEAWRMAAEKAGQSLNEWVARAASSKAGVAYVQKSRGRPKKTA